VIKSLKWWLLPSWKYLDICPPTWFDRLETRIENANQFFLKLFWIVVIFTRVAIYMVLFPISRKIGVRRRIKFWQALKANHGLYFNIAIENEYNETLKAQQIMDQLNAAS